MNGAHPTKIKDTVAKLKFVPSITARIYRNLFERVIVPIAHMKVNAANKSTISHTTEALRTKNVEAMKECNAFRKCDINKTSNQKIIKSSNIYITC